MARFVVDPPALLQLVETKWPVSPDHQLVAPNSLRSDAMTLVLERVRNDDLEEAAALTLHERMTELKIRLLGDRVSRRTGWRIARDHGVASFRSAEYIAITRLQADALIAADGELRSQADSLVPLASLQDLMDDA